MNASALFSKPNTDEVHDTLTTFSVALIYEEKECSFQIIGFSRFCYILLFYL